LRNDLSHAHDLQAPIFHHIDHPAQHLEHYMQQLLILGCGYVGTRLAKACLQKNISVFATTRDEEHGHHLKKLGIHPLVVASPCDIPTNIFQQTTLLVDSIPLTRHADDMSASQLEWLPTIIPKLTKLQWAGYLSTTGVYGDADGAWVNESHPCNPSSARGIGRLQAEQAWLNSTLPAEIFRLAGIYGPERNLIGRIKAGDYKAVQWNPPHYSSRIHVDDIIAALLAAMQSPSPTRIINLADDLPLPHADYVQRLAVRLNAPQPIILNPEEGKKQLSATALSFFSDNKRISNQRLHDELLPQLIHPTFEQGIAAILNDTESI